jgi:hypothetical protein
MTRQNAGELWHLTVDDLFIQEAKKLSGPGPFVINLTSSAVPVPPAHPSVLKLQGVHIFQISRIEDGRPRHRLRLGPISTELEADSMLQLVREVYPAASVATVTDDDKVALAKFVRVDRPTLAPVPAPAPTKVTTPSPLRAARKSAGDESPADLALTVKKINSMATLPDSKPLATTQAPADQALQIDSTLTVRALTPLDHAADEASKWFAIELSATPAPIKAESLPAQPLLTAFQLYSVPDRQSARVVHSLRLGFFSQAHAAECVAAQLASTFHTRRVTRVSMAEYERFKDFNLTANRLKRVDERHQVIELSTASSAAKAANDTFRKKVDMKTEPGPRSGRLASFLRRK